MLPLISFESLHGVMRNLYTDMLPKCAQVAQIAMGIAAIGALLYISFRVWKTLGSGAELDVFGLLRPFALTICITLFEPLVLGSLNGIMGAVESGTYAIMRGQTFDMQEHQRQKDRMIQQSKERGQQTAPVTPDEQLDRQIDGLGWSAEDADTMMSMKDEQHSFSIRSIFGWMVG